MTDERQHYMYVMYPTDPAKAANRGTWTERDFETFDLHMEHLNRLKDAGHIVLVGRTLDADGKGPAICVFQADSADEAQRIFEEEPFVTRGFCTATLHEFSNPILGSSQ